MKLLPWLLYYAVITRVSFIVTVNLTVNTVYNHCHWFTSANGKAYSHAPIFT